MNRFKNIENKIKEIVEKKYFTGAVLQINQNKKNIFSYSYGYGVRVRIENNTYPLTEINEFGWDGLLGSTGLVDPKK